MGAEGPIPYGMSLFGSIYEEAGDGPDAPCAAPDPTPAPAEPAEEPAHDAPIEVPFDAGASSMSLQDFAAEVFGNGSSSAREPTPAPGDDPLDDGARPDSDLPPAEAAPAEDPLEMLAQAADGGTGAPPATTGSGMAAAAGDEGASVFASFNAAAEAPSGSVATVESEFSHLTSTPEAHEPAEPSPAPDDPGGVSAIGEAPGDPMGGAPSLDPAPVPVSSDEAFDALFNLDDDLLPAHKPARERAVPRLGVGQLGRPIKLLVVLVVVGVAGFVGSRALSGAGGDEAATSGAEGVAGAGTVQLGDLPVSGALDPRDAGAVINSVELVGAEAELRTAAISAQAHYAEAGSFALAPAEWADLVGRTVVDGTSGAPTPGVLGVVSDDDAVCFETATDAGATVAVGVTDGALGFASDPAGGALCTVDAGVLGGWQPSLVGP